MLFRIVVTGMSARILNVAKREAGCNGVTLACVEHIGNAQVFSLDVENEGQLVDVLCTLETDRNLRVLSIQEVPALKVVTPRKNTFYKSLDYGLTA